MLIKQIGHGSFSNVYLHNDGKGNYIIKEININLLVKKYDTRNNENDKKYYYDTLNKFIKSEIDILKTINNINIVKFIDCKNKEGIYYIYMEHCCYGDVYTILKQNGYINYKKFTRHITNALLYLRDLNIIHRDIKLQNILLDNNIYKLSDFGFACYDNLELHKNNRQIVGDLCDKYFKLCGSPMYMAPEIILNTSLLHNFTTKNRKKYNSNLLFYDKLIDVWSFGLCLYELKTKSLPFPKVKNINQLENFYNDSILSQQYINAKIYNNIDKESRELLDNILQINKDKRKDIVYISEYIENIEDIMNESECLKQHIIYNTLAFGSESENLEENVTDSWQEIEYVSDIIDNNNIYTGFFKWFFN